MKKGIKMRILELSSDVTTRCECGCKFRFDSSDMRIRIDVVNGRRTLTWSIERCPFCGRILFVDSLKRTRIDDDSAFIQIEYPFYEKGDTNNGRTRK